MTLLAFLLAAVGLPLPHDAAVCEHHDSLWPLESEGVGVRNTAFVCVCVCVGGGGWEGTFSVIILERYVFSS